MVKVSYDTVSGDASIESVESVCSDFSSKARPVKSVYFSGTAAQDEVQEKYSSFADRVNLQFDEDQTLADVLVVMMRALSSRILQTDSGHDVGE